MNGCGSVVAGSSPPRLPSRQTPADGPPLRLSKFERRELILAVAARIVQVQRDPALPVDRRRVSLMVLNGLIDRLPYTERRRS